MSIDVVTAVLLILVPIAFNVAFYALGRAFDYPTSCARSPMRSCAASPLEARG
jgi:hypothetical protein